MVEFKEFICLCFSLIRLEFEDSKQNYYSEFDAVIISGYEHDVIEKQIGRNLRDLSEIFKMNLDGEEEDELNNQINFKHENTENEETTKTLVDMPVNIKINK